MRPPRFFSHALFPAAVAIGTGYHNPIEPPMNADK